MTSTTDQPVGEVPPTHVPAKETWLQRLGHFEITPRKVPLQDLQQFSRQLAVFIKAGVPLVEALDLLREEAGNKLFKKILDEIVEALQGGSTLSDAAAAHTEAFPAYYLGI